MGTANNDDNDIDEQQNRKKMERRLVLKYDLLLLPFLSFMYLFSSLDRSTLGNAVLDNFEEDVGITPDQFNTCITVFYAGFLIFQVPSNILLKRLTARRWLPLLMTIWGIIACLHATASSYAQLLVLRFLLGVFESGFFPGVLFFLTLFYKKDEMATRIALFWGSSVVAHSYAGVLAYGILRLRGAHGMTGWQWLFIIEGIPTVAVALVAWFYLPASPETWSRLSAEERVLAINRLEHRKQHFTLGDLDASNRKQAVKAFTDWKVWIWMVMFFSGSVANTSISNFLPLIIKGMGYDDKLSANLMSAPPYLAAVVVMIGVAHSSDRFQERTFHAILGASVCVVGYALLLMLTDQRGLYASMFVAVTGIFVINPIVNAWLTNNIAPEMKRSVAAAMAVSANNSAGLLGSNIYRRSDAPRYLRGHSISLSFLCVFIMLALVQRLLLQRKNRIRERICKEMEAGEEGEGLGNAEPQQQEEEQQPIIRRIGDEALDFRYRL
ncbi:major facilitator superfamily domain-containing protein [Zychaea mexicana]|uniref:major facilitator superfamily domain-containing protein n=1 Tax=Zychaea mexicana TaxID=64656 RepID=UPI0022FDCFF0|nr:major facilitator superfamily domain-containing protein [Zychaea mexicana]KAI9493037.1 major facilitator superfamily domain-containing protein [Zychaea mexicana]